MADGGGMFCISLHTVGSQECLGHEYCALLCCDCCLCVIVVVWSEGVVWESWMCFLVWRDDGIL
jgi:hypothetical protein